MISAVFRRGGDVSFVVEEMKAVFDPRGAAWMAKYVSSLLAAIGEVIECHMIEIGFLPARPGQDERALRDQIVPPDARRRRAVPGGGVRAAARDRPWACRAAPQAMPKMRRSGADPPRRLRPVYELHLFQMRVGQGLAGHQPLAPEDLTGPNSTHRSPSKRAICTCLIG
jgi:hypothetical protein